MSLRPVVTVAGFAALVFPSVAFAGEMGNALGFAGQWGASTLGYARALFPAVLITALVVEIVFRDPSAPPSFRNSLWRAAIVLALLAPVGNQTLYGRLCGALAGLSDGMASSLGPSDPWGDFEKTASKWQEDISKAKAANEDGSIAAQVGGLFFASLISLALLLGQSALWVMTQFASVLVVLLYALGPLALVFWLPVKSDSLGRWLRTFVTVLTWPVMSALLLAIITRASLSGLNGASPAFASLATALLLGVTAFAVPVVSSGLVGGSMGAIGAGMSTVMQTAGLGAGAATGALSAAGGGLAGATSTAGSAAGAAGQALGNAPGSLAGAMGVPSGGDALPIRNGAMRAIIAGAGAPGIVPNALDAPPAPPAASRGVAAPSMSPSPAAAAEANPLPPRQPSPAVPAGGPAAASANPLPPPPPPVSAAHQPAQGAPIRRGGAAAGSAAPAQASMRPHNAGAAPRAAARSAPPVEANSLGRSAEPPAPKRPRAVPLSDQPTAPSKPASLPWPTGKAAPKADNPLSTMLNSDVPPESE